MLLALAAGPTGMLMEWSYASGMELCIFMEAMEAMHNRWKSWTPERSLWLWSSGICRLVI